MVDINYDGLLSDKIYGLYELEKPRRRYVCYGSFLESAFTKFSNVIEPTFSPLKILEKASALLKWKGRRGNSKVIEF